MLLDAELLPDLLLAQDLSTLAVTADAARVRTAKEAEDERVMRAEEAEDDENEMSLAFLALVDELSLLVRSHRGI